VTARRNLFLDVRDYVKRCQKLPGDDMLQLTGVNLLERIEQGLAADEGSGGLGGS
jgi:hypothetical protein